MVQNVGYAPTLLEAAGVEAEADEYINLSTGFLFAGATWVVSTLWPVYDESAALLMSKYHELRDDENLHPAAALRKAQDWLRNDIRNYEELVKEVEERLVHHASDEKNWCRDKIKCQYENKSGPPFADPIH